MLHSEEIDQIAAALVKAQKTMKHPTFNAEGQAGTRKYPYANLTAIIDAVRPALNDNGIAVVQGPRGNILSTILVHESGQWIGCEYDLPADCTPQQMGSAITYGKRYSLAAMAGVSAEEDDDAASVEAAGRRTDDAPASRSDTAGFDEACRRAADAVISGHRDLCREWKPGGKRGDMVDFVDRVARSEDGGSGLDEWTREDIDGLVAAVADRLRLEVDARLARENGA